MIENNKINTESLRKQFPALQRTINVRSLSFLDGPGGTQVPQSVIDAMRNYLAHGSSNLGGPFLTSYEAVEVTEKARLALMDLLNARSSEEIVFGQNMTSLTFAVSRAISRGGLLARWALGNAWPSSDG